MGIVKNSYFINIMDKLILYAKQCSKKNNLILIFANSKFKAKVFARQSEFKKYGITNYLFIAMDTELYSLLKKLKLNVFLYPIQVDENYKVIGNLWIARTQIWHILLMARINILHADCDAQWLRNPLPLLQERDNIDIYFTAGTIFPVSVYNKWGFTIRCGFFFAISSPKVCEFFHNLYHETVIAKDDQVALNILLSAEIESWPCDKQIHQFSFAGRLVKYPAIDLQRTFRGMQILLLKHCDFPRCRKINTRPYVIDLMRAREVPL